VQALRGQLPGRIITGTQVSQVPSVAFLFPGQGAQYVQMARELYETETLFREQVDSCAELLQPELGLDLRDILYTDEGNAETAANQLEQTCLTQPALFVIEYALARLWLSWGIEPQAMLGHSIGEYVAATLAGVFSLHDALTLVAARGRLMQALPKGAMLAVPLPDAEVRSLLAPELSLATINAPSICVVAGPTEAIELFQQQMEKRGVVCRRLHTSHAFHSSMMEPILQPFTMLVKQTKLNAPQQPFISNVTGSWITSEQATDPSYWANHLRQTVRFASGIGELLQEPGRLLLEIGPGQTLGSLARQHPQLADTSRVISSMRQPRTSQSDCVTLLHAIGNLWLAGVQIDWKQLYADERRRRVSLPTYPFQRQRYWIEQQTIGHFPSQLLGKQRIKQSDLSHWFYLPSWSRHLAQQLSTSTLLADRKFTWLLFLDDCGIGAELVNWLTNAGQEVSYVTRGDCFNHPTDNHYIIDPSRPADYELLFQELGKFNRIPDKIMHLWTVTAPGSAASSGISALAWDEQKQMLGFYSLLYLTQALAKQSAVQHVDVQVVSTGSQAVIGGEELCPDKATLLGLCRVIPQEHSNIRCRNVDIEVASSPPPGSERLLNQLLAEALVETSHPVVAYRGHYRWVQSFQPMPLEKLPSKPALLREKGIYLITGGLGGVGLNLANYLAEAVQARLVLLGRTALPEREQWPEWLRTHGNQDSVSLRIRAIKVLEEKGAEVLAVSADSGDEKQMQAAIHATLERFGQLNGVIHAAGVSSMTAIVHCDESTCQKELYPKTQGLVILKQVLGDIPLDFCLVTSSLSAVLGGLGYAAYASANSYMDAFVQQQNQAGAVPWISINWDQWQIGGEQPEFSGRNQADIAMTAQEGVETFARILSLQMGNHVAVSATDLQTRIERWVLDLAGDTEPVEVTSAQVRQPRPVLENDFVAPRNELEVKLAGIWQELLGIEPIGIYDSFFDLGGDSLLIIRLVARLRATVGVGIAMQDLFETPTVAGLAEIVQTTLVASQALQMTEGVLEGEREEVEI
jgi:acyl transferase domain-containing protein/acyl carrier protein